MSETRFDVVTIGAGGSGSINSLATADKGNTDGLVERLAKPLDSTTDSTAQRLGNGTHYRDITTAKHIMDQAIDFYHAYQEFIEPGVGSEYRLLDGLEPDECEIYLKQLNDHYIARIRENPKNAVFGPPENLVKRLFSEPEQLKARYIQYIADLKQKNADQAFINEPWFNQSLQTPEQIQQHYIQLLRVDPTIEKVFGTPSNLFANLQPEIIEFPDPQNKGQTLKREIKGHYWVAEKIIAWPKFREHLIKRINSHPNITLYSNTEATSVTKSVEVKRIDTMDTEGKLHKTFEGQTKYTVELRNMKPVEGQAAAPAKIEGTVLLNCSSPSIEKLDHSAGLHSEAEDGRKNRTKAMLKGKVHPDFFVKGVPEEYHGQLYGVLLCYGPFAGITFTDKDPVTGELTVLVSYEPATNIENNEGLELETLSYALLTNTATQEQKDKLALSILKGADCFFPGLEKAMIKDSMCLKAGNVRSESGVTVNIFDQNSPHHLRIGDGVKSRGLNHFAVPLVKLAALKKLEEKTQRLMENHADISRQMNEVLNNNPVVQNCPDAAPVIYGYMDEALSIELRQRLRVPKGTQTAEKKSSEVEQPFIEKKSLTNIVNLLQQKAQLLAQLIGTKLKLKKVPEKKETQAWWKSEYINQANKAVSPMSSVPTTTLLDLPLPADLPRRISEGSDSGSLSDSVNSNSSDSSDSESATPPKPLRRTSSMKTMYGTLLSQDHKRGHSKSPPRNIKKSRRSDKTFFEPSYDHPWINQMKKEFQLFYARAARDIKKSGQKKPEKHTFEKAWLKQMEADFQLTYATSCAAEAHRESPLPFRSIINS